MRFSEIVKGIFNLLLRKKKEYNITLKESVDDSEKYVERHQIRGMAYFWITIGVQFGFTAVLYKQNVDFGIILLLICIVGCIGGAFILYQIILSLANYDNGRYKNE
jgi:hypothetical protein